MNYTDDQDDPVQLSARRRRAGKVLNCHWFTALRQSSENRIRLLLGAVANGQGEWRVGVLFSRTGVTSVTESEHFFGTALAIEDVNAVGGVLGRPIAPIAYDPAGDDADYRALGVGCSTSSGRRPATAYHSAWS